MSCIGQSRQDAVSVVRRFGLAPFRHLLTPSDFELTAQACGCAPRRRRPLIPEVVAWLMMYVAMTRTSMTQGLQSAWGVMRALCPGLRQAPITEEAFAKARNQLPRRFWIALWDLMQGRYRSTFDSRLRWKDLVVLGGDGTVVDLPNRPALVLRFGRPKNGKAERPQPQGRIVALCSVFTGWCHGFVFTPLRITEHQAIQHLAKTLDRGILLLLDRGFFSYVTLVLLRQRHTHFLIRLSDQAAGFARRLLKFGPDDELVEFRPSAALRRRNPQLPERLIYRRIRYQRPGFRASWLLTSLTNPKRFSREELIDLYHRRWTIETVFREWKHTLDIQNLRSHTPAGLSKEVHAQILLHNLVRWLMTEAAQGTQRTPLQFSFRAALTAVNNAILVIRRSRLHDLHRLHEELLQDIRQSPIRIRPGRSYPRKGDGCIRNRGNGKHQLPAKLMSA